MSDSEWFSKLKSHTYTYRVVHTALFETEQLPISLEFVFLLFASILYITLLFIIFEGKGIWKSIEKSSLCMVPTCQSTMYMQE